MCCSWVSLNRQAAAIAASLPDGQAFLQSASSNAVTSLFTKARAAGFTAARLFLHGEDSGFQLQTAPGMQTLAALVMAFRMHLTIRQGQH